MLDVLRVFGPPTKKVWWSVTLQNLFGVGALVSIICNFQIFKIFCLWLENAYSRPKNSFFWGDFYPKNGEQYDSDPKRHILVRIYNV